MTTQKLFKRRVRERMAKTGESYSAARLHVGRARDRLAAARTDLSGALELASDERITGATGRGWATWLSLLDGWGARERQRREIVNFLMGEHAVPGWWAQSIATGYERVRGKRLKHQQADGFTVYGSKTVNVPVTVLFDAFVDDATRARWLSDGSMTHRSSNPGRIARFDWGDGATRVTATFEEKGPTKSTVAVSHERLPDPEEAEVAKAAWKPRLSALKSFLESTPPSA